MQKIGFVGLGIMGRPMVKNLVQAGFDVTVWNRSRPGLDECVAAGATEADGPSAVAAACDIFISMVTDSPDVESVILGQSGGESVRDGAIEGLAAGSLVIDMSTISPITVHRVAARLETAGMSMLDAPVSGGHSGAKAGTLAIMAGGSEDDFTRVLPIFKVLGDEIFHLGPLGAGQTTKLVNQMLSGGIMTLIGEAMSVAKAIGLDLSQVVDVVSASSGNSTMLAARAKFLLADRFEPGFKTGLMRKDMALGLALAQDHNTPAPVAAAALQKYTAAISRGDGILDFSAVARLT